MYTASPHSSAPADRLAAGHPAPHILLVDDEEMNRDMLSRRLAKCGYSVTTAASGRESLDALERSHVDLVLLDVQMPGMSGLQVLEAIRGAEATARLPVIMVTAKTQSDDIVVALDRGANDYVTKPVDLSVALARIRTQLARRHAELRLVESEERYALAVQGSNDGLWDWKIATDEAYFSPRCKAIMGLDDEAASMTANAWFDRVHPDDFGRLRHALDGHLAGLTPQFENEHRVRVSDQQYRWVLARGVAVRGPDRAPVRVAGSLTDITEGKVADALTGLPNRVLFLDRLSWLLEREARDPERHFAVLFLDLDRFKDVNDSLGHQAGDQLLIEAARRLDRGLRGTDPASVARPRTATASHDVLARFGGDEFAIALDDVRTATEASRVAKRLVDVMLEPFRIDGQEIFISVSIGVALSTPGCTSEDLLRDADTALYRAKSAGRCRWEIFDGKMRDQVIERVKLEADLRHAVERGQFALLYQPIVSLADRTVKGFETLLRWDHPERGRIAPIDFIKVAEDTGLIVPMGLWVVDEVCRQIREWESTGVIAEQFTVSVNLSTRQLAQADLVDRVAAIVRHHGVQPTRLEFEITESAMMANPEVARRLVGDLKTLGFRISLDDFGTGYSSLSYLQHFAVDRLKIDRSFLTDATTPDWESHGIIAAVIALARHLRADVVAEGIETSSQLARVEALGCDFGQGYYFARPMRPKPVASLLEMALPPADVA